MCLFILRSVGDICTALERAVVGCCRELEVGLGACADDLARSCQYCSTNGGDVALSLLLFLFNLLACPLAGAVGLLCHLCVALMKWVPGSAERELVAWRRYCNVLEQGSAEPGAPAMQIDAQGRRVVQGMPPGEPSAVQRVLDVPTSCCRCCLAEVYCCCLPCFALYAVLLPLILLVELLLHALVATIDAAAAGIVQHPRQWWPQLAAVLRGYDLRSSTVCFANAQRFTLCDCVVAEPQVVQGAALV